MNSTRTLVSLLIAALFINAALAGCSSAETDAVTTPEPPATGGVLDGASLVQSKCTVCHNLDRVNAASKDLAGWQSTINRMIDSHGAEITPEEQSAIAIYLADR